MAAFLIGCVALLAAACSGAQQCFPRGGVEVCADTCDTDEDCAHINCAKGGVTGVCEIDLCICPAP